MNWTILLYVCFATTLFSSDRKTPLSEQEELGFKAVGAIDTQKFLEIEKDSRFCEVERVQALQNETITHAEEECDTPSEKDPLHVLSLGDFWGRSENKILLEIACSAYHRALDRVDVIAMRLWQEKACEFAAACGKSIALIYSDDSDDGGESDDGGVVKMVVL